MDGATLGQSSTQKYVYEVFLWRIPIVVTTNRWSLAGLDDADLNWLDQNCVVENVREEVWAQ